MEKYLEYKLKDYLLDDDFIRWQLAPNADDIRYWEQVVELYPQLIEGIALAVQSYGQGLKINEEKLSTTDKDQLFLDIKKDIKMRKALARRKRIGQLVSVAALFAMIFVSAWWLTAVHHQEPDIVFSGESLRSEVQGKDILLVLGDTSIALNDNQLIEHAADGTFLVGNKEYGADTSRKAKVNKLIVPLGKRSSLLLADGSKLWVNSGTVVEYPTEFSSEKREIFVDGEIYIEVEKDTKKPFVVRSPKFDVQVLGTKFNVSAYSNDSRNHVVLAEGKVEVNIAQSKVLMKPSQKFTIDGETTRIQMVDVLDYTSWRLGWIRLESLTLGELSSQLSRYYNLKIECDPQAIKLRASGKLQLFDDVEDLLEVISKNMNVNYNYNNETKEVRFYRKSI